MDADQVRLALHGVVQAQLGKIAVAGVDVVQIDVLHGQCNHPAPGNVLFGQQEQGGISKEILHVGQAESGLHGDFLFPQVVIQVKQVGKAHDLGHVLVHLRELVQHIALCQRQRLLEGGRRHGQGAGVQESVKVTQNLVLQGDQERIVRLFHRHLSAVIGYALNSHALRVLCHLDIAVGHRLHLHLGKGDLFALAHGRAALQSAVNAGLVGYQLRAGCLADGPHNAQDGAQRVPVVVEPGNEIHLAGGNVKLRRFGQILFCSH